MAAAASVPQQRSNGGAGVGVGSGTWEHRQNRSEEHNLQNMSLRTTSDSHQSPTDTSPLSPGEYYTPSSSHFPTDAEPVTGTSARGAAGHTYAVNPLGNASGNQRSYQRHAPEYEADHGAAENASSMAPPVRLKQPNTYDAQEPGPTRGHNTSNAGSRSFKRSRWEQDRERDNSSNWIHREKLIALEIQDHLDRGQQVPQALIDAQTASQGRYTSRAPSATIPTYNNASIDDSVQRSSTVSTSQHPEYDEQQEQYPPEEQYVDEEEEEEEEESYIPEDPRTPEEIAAEMQELEQASSMYYSPALRSSASRIPISKASPLPVPVEHLERNTPLPRKRSASIGLDGDSPMTYPRTRSRSGSNGSQALYDDTEPMPDPPSPTKLRQASNKSGAYKGSLGGSTPPNKPRAISGGQGFSPGGARPTTRDGRPRTANRPEEPAPWLADMYKPDPHLPPDQQIIPTHAKRIIQEQKEREQMESEQRERQRMQQQQPQTLPGSTTASSRGDRPLPQLDLSQERSQGDVSPAVPTPNGTSDKVDTPKRPGSEHGRYSTMPKVSTPSIAPATTSQSIRMQQTIHLPDPEADDLESGSKRKQKGCACCVVM